MSAVTTRTGTTSGGVLDRRALNRATLDRQMLLRRSGRSALAAVEFLVGLQAQAPFAPYFGLWSRLREFRPEELAGLLLDRSVVRIALLRNTVHLVTAADCLALRPLCRPVLTRSVQRTAGVDLAELAELARELLAGGPLGGTELGLLLARRWPEREPRVLGNLARCVLPLVQVPPRAVWGASGQTRYATVEAWPGRPLDPAPAPERLVPRYLAAFGPAGVADAQTWSGLTRLREVFDRLCPGLRVFRDEQGRELFDLPDAPRPDPDTPAPVRLLAPFDNLLLSHADRSRVVSDEHRRRLHTRNAVLPGTALVDGRVAGTWQVTRDRTEAALVITAYVPLAAPDREALLGEGARLLAFAEGDAARHDIRFTPSR